MKRFFLRCLCLLLALLLPLSALAEGGILAPLADLAASIDQMAYTRSTLSFQMDAEALRAILNPHFSTLAAISGAGTFHGMTPEDVGKMEAQQQQLLELYRNGIETYLSAAAALANEVTVDIMGTAQTAEYTIRLSGEEAMTFCLLLQEDGAQLAMSDLYPSFALRRELTDEDSFRQAQAVFQALPAFRDFDIFEAVYSAAVLELSALEQMGLAARADDTLAYTGTIEAFRRAVKNADIAYDPLYLQLKQLIAGPGDTYNESVPNDAAPANEQANRNDNASPAKDALSPASFRRTWDGETVIEEMWSQFGSRTVHEENRNEKTGAIISRSVRKEPIKIGHKYTCTPTSFTAEIVHSQDYTTVISAAKEGDAIQCVLTDYKGSYELTAVLRLARQGNALHFDGVIDPISQGYMEGGPGLLGADQDIILVPSLRVTLDLDAENGLASCAIQARQEDAWHTVLGFSAVYAQFSEAPAPLPTLGDRTVLSPNRWGDYNSAAFKKELRDIAVPRLNRLVLTKLPRDARPLLTPLLALIAALGN